VPDELEYFTRANGRQPFVEWLNSSHVQKRLRSILMAKLDTLCEEGLKLLRTKMLRSIEGTADLYELVAGQCRVGVYYDTSRSTFIVLNGVLKKKRREPTFIREAQALRAEYLGMKEEESNE
jgi:hypothetical protein